MNRTIREYATYLKYMLNGVAKTKTYHQVSQQHAHDDVDRRKVYAYGLGATDIECDVVFSDSTIH